MRLRRHTSGNPLYLGALIDELSLGELDSPGPLPAPKSYALLVLGALASHSEDAQGLARAAAVLADGALVDIAAEVAGVAAPEAALDELTRAKLITCTYADDGWRLRFLHPLVKAAVHDALGPAERVRLHTAAARLLHGEEALLHKVAAAHGPDPSVAEGLARCAAANRERGDLHRAAELYVTAAGMSDAGEAGDHHLMDAVGLYLLAGDVAATAALAERLARVAPSAQRFHLQAKVAQLAGQTREAEDLAIQAWERSEELEPEGRGPLAAILAQLCNMRGDGEAAAMWAERALSHELPPDLADSTAAARAMGLTLAGQLPEALAGLQRELSADPAAVRSDQHHQLCARGALRLAVDDLAGARADLTELSVTSGGDLAPNRLVAMGVLADVDFRLGSWDSSVAVAAQALSLAEDTGQVWIQGFLHTAVVLVAASRGDWDEADRPSRGRPTTRHGAGRPRDLRRVRERSRPRRRLPRRRGAGRVTVRAAAHPAERSDPRARPAQLAGHRTSPPWSSSVDSTKRRPTSPDSSRSPAIVVRGRASRGWPGSEGELATARRAHEPARAAFEESLDLGQTDRHRPRRRR